MSQNLQSISSSSVGAAVARSRTKHTTLVAEDSLDGREMLDTRLRLKGYEVIAAENGVEAIEAALNNSPDALSI